MFKFTKRIFALVKKPQIYCDWKRNFTFPTGIFQLKKTMSNVKIVMVRHGESEWNEKNLFCGWYNSKLTNKGMEEAKQAGKTLKGQKYTFDVAYTSVLERAQNTLCIILNEIDQLNIPMHTTWRLNERHYGGLTGLNKSETATIHGEEKVKIWRRSFDIPPPPMEVDHPYYGNIVNDPRYERGPSAEEFPCHESLKSTMERTIPYWEQTIVPQLRRGKRVLIVAHGNSLRGIIKHLECVSDEAIMDLNLPTGVPFEYTLDKRIKPLDSMKFLGDENSIKKAMDDVSNQGKKK